MAELEIVSEVVDHEATYRRSRRASRKQSVKLNKEFGKTILKTKVWPALVWSIVLSFCSVVNPLLTSFATNIQTQNLYAGMAMMKGQIPYGDFFGTSGLLFYLLALLGNVGGNFIIFGVLQFIALLIAGVYFYKIIAYFSRSEKVALSASHWFYIFIFALGFGGLYAEMFALPFILTSIWFLVRYFENAVTDEVFILYGIDAALVFLIYPKSLILWVVAGIVLVVYNVQHHQVARGFYQLLAAVFGFLLILYSVGYYAFEAQVLGMAIQQTFLYNLRLDFQHATVLMDLTIVILFLLLSGFVKNAIHTLFSFRQEKYTYIKVLMLLVFTIQLIFIVGSAHFQWSQLVLLLPYGFVMAVIHNQEEHEDTNSSYARRHFFLPVFIGLGILVQPAYIYLVQGGLRADRQEVAQYISSQTENSDKVYAWDNSAGVYISSQRLSAATITTAEPFLNTDENVNSLIYDLNKSEAKYVVVNKYISMLDKVKTILESQYKAIQTTDHFIIYQKNE